MNLSGNVIQNNITYTYGLGKGFEGGVNVFGLDFYDYRKLNYNENTSDINIPYSPIILLNLQKGFKLSKNFKIGIGSQTGSSVNYNICSFNFLNTNTNLFNNHLRLIVGGYFANRGITGPGNNYGLMSGIEIPLYKDRIVLTSDYISGKNFLSVGVVGAAFRLLKHLVFSAGYQYAGYHSPNNNGLVFELTKI